MVGKACHEPMRMMSRCEGRRLAGVDAHIPELASFAIYHRSQSRTGIDPAGTEPGRKEDGRWD